MTGMVRNKFFKQREDVNPHSRGAMRPRFAWLSPPELEEGAGKAGCALHPRSRVQSAQKKTHTSIQVQRRQSGFPCAVVYGLLRTLPGDRLSCHRRRADTSAQLGASIGAPGPHDFAVRAHLRSSSQAIRVHRIPPRVRDDREPPLLPGETGELVALI